MKKLFLKITHYGVRPEMPPNIKEQMKLVNGISFLGVPICLTFIMLFGLTGYWYLMLTFLAGLLIFILPPFNNKWMGVKAASIFVCLAAPILFGSASVISGKDTGFFLGFLVISVPPIIVFPKIKTAAVFILYAIICLVLSIAGNMLIQPIEIVTFAMGVFLFNLFTVLISSIGIVLLFKIELNDSLEKLSEKNKEITDSINYAKKIQSAYLPPENTFHLLFKDAFLLFKPKDIVSGDFYWFYGLAAGNNQPGTILHCAVADCTGHGVPGALMSVICGNALNETVVANKIFETDQILNETRINVKRSLKSTNYSGQKDGMDIALIKLNTETNELWYSGAYNPLWIKRGNEMLELAPDKQPIGVYDHEKDFTVQNVQLSKGDIIYLFSDGYADQFGGPKGKKFKYKQLNELLKANAHLTMPEQKQKLETAFENWRGELEQVDDVCVIGIRI